MVVGFVDSLDEGVIDDDSVERRIANAAAVLAEGRVVGVYHKELLPNYGVFDEARYFAESREPTRLWEIAGVTAGVSICEDIWSPEGPPARQAAAGATLLLNLNGSPFHVGKGDERAALLSAEAERSGAAVVYVNCVGGQDELVFDGDSMVFAADGSLVYRAHNSPRNSSSSTSQCQRALGRAAGTGRRVRARSDSDPEPHSVERLGRGRGVRSPCHGLAGLRDQERVPGGRHRIIRWDRLCTRSHSRSMRSDPAPSKR